MSAMDLKYLQMSVTDLKYLQMFTMDLKYLSMSIKNLEYLLNHKNWSQALYHPRPSKSSNMSHKNTIKTGKLSHYEKNTWKT